MLYVFYVNTGEMLTFGMDLITASVSRLHEAVQARCGIAHDLQVLLVSGGEYMESSRIVGSYKSAGTETSPLFLYSKQCAEVPSVNAHRDSDVQEMAARIENAMSNLPPTHETMATRVRLAQVLHEGAHEHVMQIQRLIHDQHLQHQGWAAVVANLEDTARDLTERSRLFDKACATFLDKRHEYQHVVDSFGASVDMLARASFLPCLQQAGSSDCSDSDRAALGAVTRQASCRPRTLLDWIASQERRTSLDELCAKAAAEMEKLNSGVLEQSSEGVHTVLEQLQKDGEGMKEIRGLENRLYGLEQFLLRAQKFEEEQRQMAQSLAQNQSRCRSMGSESAATVLPDLCMSHREQLRRMGCNEASLRDIRQKCAVAKHELCENLRTRLSWVIYAERKIGTYDGRMEMHHRNLQQLRQKLDILVQVHEAPRVYALLCAETHRRRLFAAHFLEWATAVSLDAYSIHHGELSHRQKFLDRLGRHFLRNLFPGLNRLPPTFATVPPSSFDEDLPNVTEDEVQRLCSELPELTDLLKVHNAAIKSTAQVHHSVLMTSLGTLMSRANLDPDERHLQLGRDTCTDSCPSEAPQREQPVLAAARSLANCSQKSLSSLPPCGVGNGSKNSSTSLSPARGLAKGSHKSLTSLPPVQPAHSRLVATLSGDPLSLSPPCGSGELEEEDLSLVGPADLDDDAGTGTQFALELEISGDFMTATYDDISRQPTIAELQNGVACIGDGTRNSPTAAAAPPSGRRSVPASAATAEQLCLWQAHMKDTLQKHRAWLADWKRDVVVARSDLTLGMDKCCKAIERQRAELANEAAALAAMALAVSEARRDEVVRVSAAERAVAEREDVARRAVLQCELDLEAARFEASEQLAATEAEATKLAERNSIELARATQRLMQSEAENNELRAVVSGLYERLDTAAVTAPVHSDSSSQTERLTLELDAELAARVVAERDIAVHEALQAAQRAHEEEIDDIVQRFEQEHVHRLNEIKASTVADNQVSFNEVIFKLTSSKDRVIEQLQREVAQLQERFTLSTSLVSKHSTNDGFSSMVSPKVTKLSMDDSSARTVESPAIAESANDSCAFAESSFGVEVAGVDLDALSAAAVHECKCNHLEALKAKDEEIQRLNEKMVASLAANSKLFQRDKVSVTTCNKGDVVLLCLDEGHGQYVVFTMGNMLHFLHSDSFDCLHLKPGLDNPTEVKKSWVLAEVVEKEYCQAKKPDNRFKVPVGTRFFRVKAKPWTPEHSSGKT